jgi:hypothetical protein
MNQDENIHLAVRESTGEGPNAFHPVEKAMKVVEDRMWCARLKINPSIVDARRS